MSAFPTGPNDKIRGVENIQTFIDHKTFTEDQFFQKDSPRMDDLNKKIDKIEALNTQYENRVYLDILQKYLDEKYADSYLRVLSEKDEKTRIGDSLKEIRILYEAMLNRLADIIPDMRNKFSDRYGNIKKDGDTIYWLEANNHISVILKNFFISIWKICSTSGHPSNFQPTTDTVNSLVYALKDVILWFGDKCKKRSVS